MPPSHAVAGAAAVPAFPRFVRVAAQFTAVRVPFTAVPSPVTGRSRATGAAVGALETAQSLSSTDASSELAAESSDGMTTASVTAVSQSGMDVHAWLRSCGLQCAVDGCDGVRTTRQQSLQRCARWLRGRREPHWLPLAPSRPTAASEIGWSKQEVISKLANQVSHVAK